jgi:RNA polymerase sigma factor (sigma-70 family)
MTHSVAASAFTAGPDNVACVRREWPQSKQSLSDVNPPHSEQDRWFEEEVQPHEPALRAYLRRNFPDVTDLDDLVQESYARLLEARRKEAIANAKGYLFSIARNAAISLLRRPKVFSDQPVSDRAVQSVAEEGRDVARLVCTRQEVAVLLDAIDTLPSRCREIFIMTKLKGLSHQEAADRLGLSIQTVHVQVARGFQKCTEFLRVRGILKP